MPTTHLSLYLNDHFAGAGAAVEIMDYIEASHGDTAAGIVMKQLRPEIIADKDELGQLIERVGASATTLPRRALGWIAEKAVELKLRVDDPSDGAFRLLESIELLTVGIESKIMLWNSLRASQARVPALADTDFDALIRRAESQRVLIEPVRLDAALEALS